MGPLQNGYSWAQNEVSSYREPIKMGPLQNGYSWAQNEVSSYREPIKMGPLAVGPFWLALGLNWSDFVKIDPTL